MELKTALDRDGDLVKDRLIHAESETAAKADAAETPVEQDMKSVFGDYAEERLVETFKAGLRINQNNAV